MRVFFQKMSFSGIKNIRNEITIDFTNKKVSKGLDYTKVKAIYGPNGAGKTAVVDALKFYQALTNENTRLYNPEFQEEVIETINKIVREMTVSITAIITNDKGDTTTKISHLITLATKNKEVIITNEVLKLYKNINSNVISKQIVHNNTSIDFFKVGQAKIIGYESSKRSIVEMYSTYFKSMAGRNVTWEQLSDQDREDFDFMLNFFKLSESLYIISEDADKHSYYFYNKNEQDNQILEESTTTKVRHSIYDEVIDNSDIEWYRSFYDKIESFVKVFKTDLIKIDLEYKQINEKEVKIEKYFNYGTYRVHMEFESAGIKKLVKLYAAIHNAVHGRITVIDEFDANINDIYLNKIIEYVIFHAKGQIIFTTHNTSPMDILRNHKRSIDFINESGELVNWIINGNSSPAKSYQNGAIEGLPFNIDSFDFIGLFDEEN